MVKVTGLMKMNKEIERFEICERLERKWNLERKDLKFDLVEK
jgi:hypothetical protein